MIILPYEINWIFVPQLFSWYNYFVSFTDFLLLTIHIKMWCASWQAENQPELLLSCTYALCQCTTLGYYETASLKVTSGVKYFACKEFDKTNCSAKRELTLPSDTNPPPQFSSSMLNHYYTSTSLVLF